MQKGEAFDYPTQCRSRICPDVIDKRKYLRSAFRNRDSGSNIFIFI